MGLKLIYCITDYQSIPRTILRLFKSGHWAERDGATVERNVINMKDAIPPALVQSHRWFNASQLLGSPHAVAVKYESCHVWWMWMFHSLSLGRFNWAAKGSGLLILNASLIMHAELLSSANSCPKPQPIDTAWGDTALRSHLIPAHHTHTHTQHDTSFRTCYRACSS